MKDHSKTMQELDEKIREAQKQLARMQKISLALKERSELISKLNEKLNIDYGLSTKDGD